MWCHHNQHYPLSSTLFFFAGVCVPLLKALASGKNISVIICKGSLKKNKSGLDFKLLCNWKKKKIKSPVINSLKALLCPKSSWYLYQIDKCSYNIHIMASFRSRFSRKPYMYFITKLIFAPTLNILKKMWFLVSYL